MRVSVVICCHLAERLPDVLAAAASVEQQSLPATELVVVVDHNLELLTRLRAALPDVPVVASDGPKGLSAARNTGVAATSGEVVAFLDDDAIAERDWLEHLIAPYARADVVGVGGAIQPLWERGRPRWFPEEFDWVVGCSYRGLPPRPAPVRNLIGANMSFRRTALDAAGAFALTLGRNGGRLPVGSCEDTEISIRILRAHPASVLLYEPAARIRHRVPPDRSTWSYFWRRCRTEGRAKAALVSLGGSQSLTSERDYTVRVLPRGVVRGLSATVGGETAGAARSAAIVAGFFATGAAYAAARARATVPAGARG
jgi:cellulose synthase/poly-beta-1,6-N-acetylglucosamine synthase-like glycosyltransferase